MKNTHDKYSVSNPLGEFKLIDEDGKAMKSNIARDGSAK
jgi:hypothetical protein